MSNISSNSLFHFTRKRKHLISILKQTFVPRYCFEEIKLIDTSEKLEFATAVPMVCFCDISLSQITNHVKMYGSYGLGMTKEWGISNQLNPIIYVNPNSRVSECVGQMAESAYHALENNDSEIGQDLLDQLITLVNFLKPYIGDFKRGQVTHKNIRFYNEREWRYVPKIESNAEAQSILSKTAFLDSTIRENENKKLTNYKLGFRPNDIKYIFVKSEEQIHPMMEELRSIKWKFSPKEIDVLTSKIITIEQVKQDF